MAGAVEYTDGTSVEEEDLGPTSILGMTLNCIWWRGSSHETLGNVEYLFIAIAPRSTQRRYSCNCKGSIYGPNITVQ